MRQVGVAKQVHLYEVRRYGCGAQVKIGSAAVCHYAKRRKQVLGGAVALHTVGEKPFERDAYYLGQLIYFFERACGISGLVLGVNPFDQPGVEAYKKNMFALLGKPGYEAETEAIQKRL